MKIKTFTSELEYGLPVAFSNLDSLSNQFLSDLTIEVVSVQDRIHDAHTSGTKTRRAVVTRVLVYKHR